MIWVLSYFCGTTVHAHGGGTPQVTDEVVGPYRLFVWTQPEPLQVGEVHLSLVVTEPSSAETPTDGDSLSDQLVETVTDAQIRVGFSSISEPENQFVQIANQQNQLGQRYYEVDTVLPTEGMWQVVIDVEGRTGAGETEFELFLKPARRVNWVWVVGIGIGLLFTLWLLGLRSRRSR